MFSSPDPAAAAAAAAARPEVEISIGVCACACKVLMHYCEKQMWNKVYGHGFMSLYVSKVIETNTTTLMRN